MKKKITIILLCLTCLFVGFGCSKQKSINIVETQATMFIGQEKIIEFDTQEIPKESVVWSSSNDKIVSVKNGKVTALSLGEATITASFEDVTDTITVTVVKDVYLDLGLQSTEMIKGQSFTLKPFIGFDGEFESVEVTYTVSGSSVVIENGVLKAVGEGESTIVGKCVYLDKEFSSSKTVVVKEVSCYASLKTLNGEDVNLNVSLKAGYLLSEQLSLAVYDENGIKEYTLKFNGSQNLTVDGVERTLNSKFIVMEGTEEKGQVTLGVYAQLDLDFVDVIDEDGMVTYPTAYNYGFVFSNLTVAGKSINCYSNSNVKLNVVPQNALYDFASLNVSQVKKDFTTNAGSSVSLSNDVEYRGANTLRFNTQGQWYPTIHFDEIMNQLDKKYRESKISFSFKVYFDHDNTSNMVFFCNFKKDTLLTEGNVKPREWTEIKIELSESEMAVLSSLDFYVQMYSNGSITGADYSIYFADFTLGSVSYKLKSLEFENAEYTISNSTDFKVLINDSLCDSTDERVVSAEYSLSNNIAYVKDGKIYAVRKGSATLTLTVGEVSCQTTVITDNLPNGEYNFENMFALNGGEDYCRIIQTDGTDVVETTSCAYAQLSRAEDYYDLGDGTTVPVMEYHEYKITSWNARYLELKDLSDSFDVGDVIRIRLKHDYEGENAFDIRSYSNQFFNAKNIEKVGEWITIELEILNKPQNKEFYFQLCDSEASANINTLIYRIDVLKRPTLTEQGEFDVVKDAPSFE